MLELAITVKNEEQSLTQKHLIYDKIEVSHDDTILSNYVELAKSAFGENIEDIILKIRFVW